MVVNESARFVTLLMTTFIVVMHVFNQRVIDIDQFCYYNACKFLESIELFAF